MVTGWPQARSDRWWLADREVWRAVTSPAYIGREG